MSKKGLPFDVKMRHDSHYVDELAGPSRSIGRKIQTNLLEPNPNQPRAEIGDLTELAGSIKLKGVLEPILVKPDAESGTWMIIAGERRWRAATIAGLTEVPCIELDIDEKDIAEIALIENLQRKDLTIWEEADGFAYLIQRFGYTHEEIAKKIGKSRSTITESLSIAGLPSDIRSKCLENGINTKSSLLEIARQFDEQAMYEYLKNLNRIQTKKKSTGLRPQPGQTASSNKRASPAETDETFNKEKRIFTFFSPKNTFNLEITFNEVENSGSAKINRSEILAALKETFNDIKNGKDN